MALISNTATIFAKLYYAVKKGVSRELSKRDGLPGAFHHYKCIFVHIPKSAGTSVCKTLFGYQIGHRKYTDYIMNSSGDIQNYYKFSFVRNPWDRVLSAYLYLRNGSESTTPKDKQWADANMAKFESFNDFVKEWLNEENINKTIHFIPQYKFISDGKGVIKMDFVGRFENISNDFKRIASIVGYHQDELPRTNPTQHKHYSIFYNDASIETVRHLYSIDITTFNYAFEDKRANTASKGEK